MNAVKWFADYMKLFTTKLRLSNPWRYKVPLLISFPYFFLAQGVLTTQQATLGFFAALLTTIGFAGVGYLTNDWSDREKDQIAEKENPTTNWKRSRFLAFLILFIGMALLPWLYLPFDLYSLLLIGFELVLFVLYAFPPFRLKERGILGVITDALYAHVVPGVLASYTFHLFTHKSYEYFPKFIVFLAVWQLVSGMRNILYHQLIDIENDEQSGVATFVTKAGVKTAKKVKFFVLLPLEFLTFGLFLTVVAQQFNSTYIIIAAGLAYSGTLFLLKKRDTTSPLYKRISNAFLDSIYILFFPLIPLYAMIFEKTEVTYILLAHILLFRNLFIEIAKGVISWWKNSRLFQLLFKFESYLIGVLTHTALVIIYGGVFCALYFVLKGQIEDQEYFFYLQRLLSRALVGLILMHLGIVIWMRKNQTIITLKRFFQDVGDPRNLALFRIIFFLVVIGSFVGEVFGPFTEWTYLDDSHRVGLPFIKWLTDILPITPELYRILSFAGLVLAVQILLGFKTRVALLLYVPVALYLWGVPNFFGKLNHRHIMVWVPMILMFSRCGDAFSIDSWMRRRKKKPSPAEPSVVYALPLKFIWITLAIIYCTSGFHKLWDTGLHWALSDNLRNQIALEWVENYDNVPSLRIDEFPLLLRFGAASVILMELLFPLLIFKSSLRPFACLSAWGLHLSAGYFLFIDFFHLRIANLSFLNWKRLSDRVIRKRNIPEQKVDPDFNFKKFRKMPMAYVVVPLLSINLLFSILQISSWPFSGYPSYSSIVDDKITLIRMEAIEADGTTVDVKALGKAAQFRWENIRPYEERIIYLNNAEDTSGLHMQLQQYWELWETKVAGLDDVVEVKVYFETTSIFPEKRGSILKEGFLGELNLKNEN